MEANKNKKFVLKNKHYQIICAVLFLTPALLALIGFAYYPAIDAIFSSFTEWDGFYDPVFVGLKNYQRLLADPIFWQSIRNVLLWSAGSILAGTTLPYIASELVFAVKNKRAQYIYRSLLVLPMIVPTVVTIEIWRFMYEPNHGLLNTLLRTIGLESLARNWLGQSNLVIPSLIFIGFPWVSGLNFLIFYAGLQNISTDILEYARLDGCTGLRRIFYIDLPLTMPQIKLALILGIINNFQNVTVPLLLTNGGPGYDSYVPGLYMYFKAFKQSEFGYGTTIATVMFMIIMVLTLISNRMKAKEG